MIDRRLLKNLDFTLILVIIAILTISLLAIFSASIPRPISELGVLSHIQDLISKGQDPFGYAQKQIIWIIISTFVLLFILSFDYKDFGRYSNYLYLANIVILLLVIFKGQEALGAQRWIDIGPFRFQPSEFAKVIIIITFANFLAKRQNKLHTFWQLVPAFLYVAVPMLLILIQPDLGTSLVFIAIMFGMLFIASSNPALVGGLFMGGVTAAVTWVWLHLNYGLWIPLKSYQLTRITIFMDPYADYWGAGYHIIQSLIAVGSGGFWGKGFMQGQQNQNNFLPEQHTDFIFSVIGEEFGFIGALVLLFFFFLFVYRSLNIASKSQDMFGTLMVTGVVAMFVFQVLVNVGMTIAMMPITGLPLPLVSYGGSSMLANMIAIAIILNVGLRRQKLMF